MKKFLGDDFLLENKVARDLYYGHAARMPIIDFHCHLPPEDIANDTVFRNLTHVWLAGDHYKWRALRSNGIPERLITGTGTDEEKFLAWAQTVPRTLRNPLYHWTHLELRRFFGVKKLLDADSAPGIWRRCNEMLATPEFSARNLLRKMDVRLVCTTDDPADSLQHHRRIREEGFDIQVLPTFRPDAAMAVDDPAQWNAYLDRLGDAADIDIRSYDALVGALDRRHAFFHEMGGRLSDHGLETVPAEDFTAAQVKEAFTKLRARQSVSPGEIARFRSALMIEIGRMNHARGWTMQLHMGPIRNNSTRSFQKLGRDAGFDSIGDAPLARPLAKFLDALDRDDRLPKTILYNINPRDNYLMGTMIGNFQDGTVPGKIQWGASWWFLDQKEGIAWHFNALSALGLLSRFVGMVTDSRSFLSGPRHEYFRRILCNLIGTDAKRGELPLDMGMLGALVKDVCFNNAKGYFGFNLKGE
ncbi:MAG TPA: glucuronate isomerase [Verrucomicrobiae bacterium]|nr:glucuronate isomerase [Verrucomicrobiae bacterium]